jgi:ribosomal subunit interface protein
MARLEIHGVHFDVDDNLKKYIIKKITKLNKYLPPETRESFHVEVYISESKSKGGKLCNCEVVYHLPKEKLRINEGTVNIYAAVDIVEEKSKQALIKYKELHEGGRKDRSLLRRLKFQF